MDDPMMAAPASAVSAVAGPLEAHYLGSRFYRNVAATNRITVTHWHIAWANGLGWGFDGMDGAILALVAAADARLHDRARHSPQRRADIATDRHRRNLLLALAGRPGRPAQPPGDQHRGVLADDADRGVDPELEALIAAHSVVRFALNGEWAVGSSWSQRTWPTRLRGRVIGVDRGAWCIGAALAGGSRPGW